MGNIKRDIQFLFEIGSIRRIERTWRQFGFDASNVAEHIFRVAWIALTLSRHEGEGDEGKILKLAMTHDIAESRTGDVNYLSRQYTKRDDKKAFNDIALGTIHQSEILALSEEYEERKTIESRIVKDADTLDVELELRELNTKGNLLPREWKKHRYEYVFPTLYTKSAKYFWKSIATANPIDWHHLSSGNRFRGGDWKKRK